MVITTDKCVGGRRQSAGVSPPVGAPAFRWGSAAFGQREGATCYGEEERALARGRRRVLALFVLLFVAALSPAQSAKKPAKTPAQRQLETTTRALLSALQAGSPAAVAPYISSRGLVVDMDGERLTPAELRRQFAGKTGLYCRWFDTPCLQREMEEQSGGILTQRTAEPRAYRELLRLAARRDFTVTIHPDQPDRGAVSVCLHGPKLSATGAGYLLEFGFERVAGRWRLALEEGNFAGC